MTYAKRFDGRGFEDLRPIEAKAGVIPNADGSGFFKIGGTSAYAAVYGPHELHPRFLQNPKTGRLRCHYNMMPFSGDGDRVRPGTNRRSKEISLVTEKALRPVVDLKEYPNAVVDVFIELIETNAGSRCAGICAAAIALADAGIPMTDLVASVSVGKVDDKIVVDLDGEEEHYENNAATDIPMAMIQRSNEITLLQMDGYINREELNQALKVGQKVMKKIFDVQKKALKDQFKTE